MFNVTPSIAVVHQDPLLEFNYCFDSWREETEKMENGYIVPSCNPIISKLLLLCFLSFSKSNSISFNCPPLVQLQLKLWFFKGKLSVGWNRVAMISTRQRIQ